MTQTALLALDGEGITIKNMLVSPSMQFQEKDQSGQTSSTANSEQGIKAKELRVSGLITFDDQPVLQRLFQIASATDASGALKLTGSPMRRRRPLTFVRPPLPARSTPYRRKTASPGR